jgi:mannose-6-phosphate isomerase
MQEEQVILVNEKDEPIGLCPKMEAHEKALLHRAFSVFIFNDEGKLLLQQRAAHKYHSPRLWTNTVCSHQRENETNLEAGKRRLNEEMGMKAALKELFHFIYKAEFDNGLTEHELDHVMIGFSNKNPHINTKEVMDFRWESLENIETDIKKHPEKYTEWFKIIFKNSIEKLKNELDRHFLQKPLIFYPVFKEKPWGGTKLKSVLNKDIPSEHTGESWEVSTVPQNISIVKNGYFKNKNLQELLDKHQENLVGKNIYQKFGNKFPLLIKYIDAADDLSVQVHPDDKIAGEKHQSFGKNELWHIIETDEDAFLYLGFQKQTGKDTYLQALKTNKLENILRKIPVKRGDTFYIPAGTVHAIGKGILLAEIQQNSDLTYRIFDWNRKGLDGKPRKLHTEWALDAIDFSSTPKLLKENKIITPYFSLKKLKPEKPLRINLTQTDNFIILMNIEGEYEINKLRIHRGDTVLIPAITNELTINPLNTNGEIHLVYIETNNKK